MKIGIDISSIQGPHRMRGIGYTTVNFLSNLPNDETTYVFYADAEGEISPAEAIKSININTSKYEIRTFSNIKSSSRQLPGKLRYFSKISRKVGKLREYSRGVDIYSTTSDLDAFIQFDQSAPLPNLTGNTKLYFIAYDLIPYVLEKDYLISYTTARQRGENRRSSFKSAVNRHLYLIKIKLNCKKADGIFAISETTKDDFIKYGGVDPNKIRVVKLGIANLKQSSKNSNGEVNRYLKTSWGYLPTKTSLINTNFLLFVGGADSRRRLDDLVAAFNHLRAGGVEVKLVLSGDIMKGPLQIPSYSIQTALRTSSYIDDIYFVGFTDDSTRDWLYTNAVAFVFPSVYEGFGLPVLEAMSLQTPVVCYENKAVKEVALHFPLYAHDTYSLVDAINSIRTMKKDDKTEWLTKASEHAISQTWTETTKTALGYIYE